MSRNQIIFSVILTVASLAIGYWLSFHASKKANDVLLGNLREELNIINKSYDSLLLNPNIDEATKRYLMARKEYLENKIINISELVQTY